MLNGNVLTHQQIIFSKHFLLFGLISPLWLYHANYRNLKIETVEKNKWPSVPPIPTQPLLPSEIFLVVDSSVSFHVVVIIVYANLFAFFYFFTF